MRDKDVKRRKKMFEVQATTRENLVIAAQEWARAAGAPVNDQTFDAGVVLNALGVRQHVSVRIITKAIGPQVDPSFLP